MNPKHGHRRGPNAHNLISIVRASREWECEGALTPAGDDDGFQGIGNTFDAYLREQVCEGPIPRGGIYVKYFGDDDDGPSAVHRCCLACALHWGVIVPEETSGDDPGAGR